MILMQERTLPAQVCSLMEDTAMHFIHTVEFIKEEFIKEFVCMEWSLKKNV
jgi:hypothetical protein